MEYVIKYHLHYFITEEAIILQKFAYSWLFGSERD